ncbi:hypothetical protein C2845_PM09G14250 [Panicum miliaceum]|uniref:REF/SRPP-like protein n=1 Tax=Panicum miliaceum TaxID=4540 RepID=A0A3L6RXE7_PANMI|nr:hypothetical protein C2845_PM09G14250 [Panicum miliaceum]
MAESANNEAPIATNNQPTTAAAQALLLAAVAYAYAKQGARPLRPASTTSRALSRPSSDLSTTASSHPARSPQVPRPQAFCLALVPSVTRVVLPAAAQLSAKYNLAVMDGAKRGNTVATYLPLVPTERLAKVFRYPMADVAPVPEMQPIPS